MSSLQHRDLDNELQQLVWVVFLSDKTDHGVRIGHHALRAWLDSIRYLGVVSARSVLESSRKDLIPTRTDLEAPSHTTGGR
eukprot:1833305-Rhodomonas_salina.2